MSAKHATKKVFMRTKTKLMPIPSQMHRDDVAGMMKVEPTMKAKTSDKEVTKMERPTLPTVRESRAVTARCRRR